MMVFAMGRVWEVEDETAISQAQEYDKCPECSGRIDEQGHCSNCGHDEMWDDIETVKHPDDVDGWSKGAA